MKWRSPLQAMFLFCLVCLQAPNRKCFERSCMIFP
jgi:hypothetical protein